LGLTRGLSSHSFPSGEQWDRTCRLKKEETEDIWGGRKGEKAAMGDARVETSTAAGISMSEELLLA